MVVTTCRLTWLQVFSYDSWGDSLGAPSVCNQVALHIASNPIFREQMTHIHIDCHCVRNQLLSDNIAICHIHTNHLIAHIFTKALG